MENANILAIPLFNENAKIKFSIADSNGNYNLNLLQDKPYRIEISYMGYEKITDTLELTYDYVKNYTLTPSNVSLDEIIITDRIPVKIRKDTITYRPEKFVNGNERKLRDVLKKLPGITIDVKGNVKVNNKDVNKLLIEGKEFFTGDEKLGVNNIPAEVIDEIEVIENYNEIKFLKGLDDNEQLVLNIKLEDGKKKFAFGSANVGLGSKDSYLINPTLFYYSSKTSLNLIGDLNNIGKKEFTVEDYLEFEGGLSLFGEDPKAYFNILQDDFSRFLMLQDYTFSRNHFGAISINQKVSKKIKLDAYSIFSSNSINSHNENNFAYFTSNLLNEYRVSKRENKFSFSLNKIKLNYSNFLNTDIKYEAFLKTNNGKGINEIESKRQKERANMKTENSPLNFDLTQVLVLNKQISTAHTYTLSLSHKYRRNKQGFDYYLKKPFFVNFLSNVDQESNSVNINQEIESDNNDFKVNFKHYWVLHRFHHIYPEAGINTFNQSYMSLDKQIFNDNVRSFFESGFDNNVDFDLVDRYFGNTYKAKFGNIIFSPSLFIHNYKWKLKQFNEELQNRSTSVFLPKINIDWEIKDTEKLRFRYQFNSNFANISQLANRFRLRSFNSVITGNESLKNEISQNASISYSKFSILNGFFINARLSYLNKIKTFKNKTSINGFDHIRAFFLSEIPENNYSGNISLTKRNNDYTFKLISDIKFSNYSNTINEVQQNFKSDIFSYELIVNKGNKLKDTYFEVGFRHRINKFEGNNVSNYSTLINPFVDFEYRLLDNFVLNLNYVFNYYENSTFNEVNIFQLANASLLFNKNSNPWSFKLEVSNVFDVQSRDQYSINDFYLSESRTFLQPRIGLFSLEYNF